MTGKALAIVATIACAVVVSPCASQPMPGDSTAQRLVGRWSQVFTFGVVRDELVIDLEADATIRVKIRRHSVNGMQEYTGSGKWRVEDGDFVSELAFGGPLDAVDHLVGRHRIVAVTEWQWVTEFRNREQLTAWRYPK
jgi:hypothetical protein